MTLMFVSQCHDEVLVGMIPTTGQSTNNVLDNGHVSKYIIYRTYIVFFITYILSQSLVIDRRKKF